MSGFYEGEYIIYRNGEKYELGRIASLREDGAFVCYHEGETAAKTPYDHMHKLINAYAVKATSLGGSRFQKGGEENLLPDSTLHITVDIDVSKVKRILLSQDGTHYGELYYADAEPEIVRCKNCEYYHPYYCAKWSKFGTIQTPEDGYCHMAERREE